MKLKITEVALGPAELLAGRIRGDRVFETLIAPAVREPTDRHQLVILSFRDVNFTTGSFIKATWMRLHDRTIPTMVAHLGDEIRTEFAMFLDGQRLPGLEALDWQKDEVTHARLHGPVEASSRSALQALIEHPGSTAPELHDATDVKVSATAWTNRLKELHKHGLAVHGEKSGRAWRYYPVARGVDHG